VAVRDGTLTYGPPVFPPPSIFLFANATREELDPLLREHGVEPESWQAWTSDYTCLLVDTGKRLVLVDTGAGSLAPSTGRLLHNLSQLGVTPEDVDTVILTHAHPDHIGGNTDAEGKLCFPKARYVMWRDEWDFWHSGRAERELDEHVRPVLLGSAQRNLPPIRSRLDLVSREEEIVPGIRALAAPGHTPGQMALEISSQGERLLCVSDAVLHPVHVRRPHLCAAVDCDPQAVVATRRRLLDMAAEGGMAFAFHFPFPGLGRITRRDNTWQWQAAQIPGQA
jgi:glyoxylase-like metal-dependent hydrolase (beta-lactamase superfamily II)